MAMPAPFARQGGGFKGGAMKGGDENTDKPSIELDDVQLKPIPTKLFSDVAEAKAKIIAKAPRGNDRTQLRRFYDELVKWNDQVEHVKKSDRSSKYEEIAPFVQMLNAQVAYAKGRLLVDANFEALFRHVVGQIQDADTLQTAKLFMEAFMGFYRSLRKN